MCPRDGCTGMPCRSGVLGVWWYLRATYCLGLWIAGILFVLDNCSVEICNGHVYYGIIVLLVLGYGAYRVWTNMVWLNAYNLWKTDRGQLDAGMAYFRAGVVYCGV